MVRHLPRLRRRTHIRHGWVQKRQSHHFQRLSPSLAAPHAAAAHHYVARQTPQRSSLLSEERGSCECTRPGSAARHSVGTRHGGEGGHTNTQHVSSFPLTCACACMRRHAHHTRLGPHTRAHTPLPPTHTSILTCPRRASAYIDMHATQNESTHMHSVNAQRAHTQMQLLPLTPACCCPGQISADGRCSVLGQTQMWA
jgi:hypothetical protein